MIRVLFLFVATLLPVVLLFALISLHLTIFLRNGMALDPSQLEFPIFLDPHGLNEIAGGGMNVPVILALGVACGTHQLLFKKLFVKKWKLITQEDFEKFTGRKKD